MAQLMPMGYGYKASFYTWAALVVFCATVLPRLCSLGDFPYLDDGYHAFMAQYIHHALGQGRGFPPDITGYKLFEVLFSWLWGLPGNALFWLRLADLGFAIIAGFALCVLLCRESKSRLIGLLLALACLAGLNLPGVIQSGFKYSFFPAYACFFIALNLAKNALPKSWAWFFCGALAALGVLFRETFFPFVILACFALLIGRKFSALWRFIIGGILAAILITLISALYRQQIYGIFEFYLVYGKIYGPEAARRWLKFIENGGRALLIFGPVLGLFCLALAELFIIKGRQFTGRAWFWLLCAILPICEPLLKIGFLYHFSVCLPGLAGFCAYAYSRLPARASFGRKLAVCACGIAAFLMLCQLGDHFKKAPVTWEVIKAFPEPGWPDKLIEKSSTLAVAAKIRELSGPGQSLATSGFTYFLFPASMRLPPQVGLADLSRTLIYSGGNPALFRKRLLANPPDLVVICHAADDHSEIFEDELKRIFANLPEYEKAAELPVQKDKNYGWLAYTIYKRKTAP